MPAMISIIVNGFAEKAPAGSSLLDIITAAQAGHKDLIAEVNNRFIHQDDYAAIKLEPGDRVELIHAAFGG